MRSLAATAAVWLVALVAVAGGAEVAVKSSADVDFSVFRTYRWGDGTPARMESVEDRIRRSVDQELAAHGLMQVGEKADLVVVSHMLVDQHTLRQLSDTDQWEFWTGFTETRADEIGAGTLVVDLKDGPSGRLVWRGLVTGAVDGKPSKLGARIDKAIQRMFRDFPRSSVTTAR